MKMDRPSILPPTAPASRIALADLCYGIGGKDILSDISFDVAARRVGIVGRNGSGKSTLARVLAGLVAPDAGQVRINGRDLARDRRAALAEIGILFQNPDHQIIFPTVAEEIGFGLRQIGLSKTAAQDKVRATLAAFGKSHWAEAHVTDLSQGQKHLVCLIAVMAMAPRAILLDEPFSGLDIPTKAQLARYLARYDGTLIHITHDPRDLTGYDHVIWLDSGRVAQSGAADAVLAAYVARMEELGGLDDISDLAG